MNRHFSIACRALARISDFDRVLKNFGVRTLIAKCQRHKPAIDSGGERGNRLGREQWRAGSCLPGEARIQLESWRPVFTL